MTTAGTESPTALAAERGWSLVIPVRGGDSGKSRLEHPRRESLAAAFAFDTVAAAASAVLVREILVVAAAPVRLPRIRGVRVVADPGAGLNAAIRSGLSAATDHRRHSAALLGDLPALQPGELDDALRRAAAFPRAFVGDVHGTGTTLVTARSGIAHDPAFGVGSAAAHRGRGYRPLEIASASGLRRDIDDVADLSTVRQARPARLGRRTSAVLAGVCLDR